MSLLLSPSPVAARDRRTRHPGDLIDELLREQATLTAVETFSEWHSHREPALAPQYRALLPLTMPMPGQQLAFEVNLDLCSGCKACVVACHTLNGLDEHESFRDVGLLVSADSTAPVMQHVTTACHHCVDPGCLNGCPVNAYEKDPITGIVRHLDDQCFGCQYCTLMCPYDVPKFHAAKGIVRKCDMCSQRLAVGEAPACVQACPHQAIRITCVETTATSVDSAQCAESFLPSSPDPRITRPTTRYIGRHAHNASLIAATVSVPTLEQAHWPLIGLLVLSQYAVGIVSIIAMARLLSITTLTNEITTTLLAIAVVLAIASAISSTLHLGRPLLAWRAVLGIGHSWLSREIVAFGAFIGLCCFATAASVAQAGFTTAALVAATVAGLAGVACSVMIYHVTRRPLWHASRSTWSFAATVLSEPSFVCALALSGQVDQVGLRWLGAMVVVAALMRGATIGGLAARREPARFAIPRRMLMSATVAAGIAGLIISVLPGTAFVTIVAAIGLIASLVADVLNRWLFFRAVVPLTMPGVPRR